jgi:hypothetical protein
MHEASLYFYISKRCFLFVDNSLFGQELGLYKAQTKLPFNAFGTMAMAREVRIYSLTWPFSKHANHLSFLLKPFCYSLTDYVRVNIPLIYSFYR